jgi:hypothetical protein
VKDDSEPNGEDIGWEKGFEWDLEWERERGGERCCKANKGLDMVALDGTEGTRMSSTICSSSMSSESL